jgi:hypothetical protein
MIWGPPKPQERLTPINVKMGHLQDFCELIRLEAGDDTTTLI